MGFREGQVLVNHVFQHEEKVTLRVVPGMPKHRISLGLRNLPVLQSFHNQLAHLFWQQFLSKTTPKLIAGFGVVTDPQEAVRA